VANSGTTVIPATSYFRRSHQNTFSYIAPGVYAAENLTLTDADGTYGYFDVRVVIPVTGKYTLSCSYARNGGGWDNAYKIYVDGGATATYSPSVIQTASWKDFRTDEVATLELTKGEHTFRVQNGSGGLNILDIQLTACEHVAGPLVVDTPATQTTAGKGHKECSVCGYYAEDDIVIPATCEASIGNTNYTTLAQALAAAQSGQTVKLIGDLSKDGVVVKAGVTLDLAGHVLTTDYLVGLDTSSVINSAENEQGKVVTAKENVALSEDNAYLPVYDETSGCFLFTRVKNDRFEVGTQGGKPKYSTAPMFKDYVHSLMDTEKEAAASGVEIIVRLTWCDATGQYLGTQDYRYFDHSVSEYVDSYEILNGSVNYGKEFYGIFVGSEIVDGLDVQVSTVVRSATGVEMVSAPTTLFA
ncbi:MAG: hypothetical protein IJN42_00465, partial [Clostridia bacterium]|nr:hypothetical protein [Clostridia bacterium]